MRIFLWLFLSLYLSAQGSIVLQNNFGPAADDIYSISTELYERWLLFRVQQKDPSTQSEMIAVHCSARTIVDGAESLQIMARSFVGPRLAHTRCMRRRRRNVRRERLFVAEIRANAASLRNSAGSGALLGTGALGFFNVCDEWNEQRGDVDGYLMFTLSKLDF
jgi:hypothetical protein